jgi:oxygen-independent coproporphyrinogen III oxidase
MKLLAGNPREVNLKQLIRDQVQGDYVYMYPPRQAYRPMAPATLETAVQQSLAATVDQPLNLYLHFPFCRQICGFCNLYSVNIRSDDPFAEYVDLLDRELAYWSMLVRGRTVSTIYLGGGTPSILPVAQLDRCLGNIERALGLDRSDVAEVALEVAPDTVDAVKLRQLQAIGITRVNLGLQTTSDEGLHQIGRRHGFSLARQRIESALESGFANVCVDVIYGLPEQTVDQWRATVKEVLNLGASTVCAYPLTLRPNTGFSRRELTICGATQYQKYEIALELLSNAGYQQETHVRYVIAGRGGYLQKSNHWAGQDIVGVGAGARGYLRHCDYRNGYSILRRRAALESYRSRILDGQRPFVDGIALDRDERIRRHVILGLLELDLSWFDHEHSVNVRDVFATELFELARLGLIEDDGAYLRLTGQGRKYRDIVVQRFFSDDVWQRIAAFDYCE